VKIQDLSASGTCLAGCESLKVALANIVVVGIVRKGKKRMKNDELFSINTTVVLLLSAVAERAKRVFALGGCFSIN
jgi:hypothetical protein